MSVRRVWLLGVGTVAVGTDLFVLAGILPVMAGALRVSEAAAGQSTTAFSVAYAVATPILAATALSVSLPMLLVTRAVAALELIEPATSPT